MEPNANDLVEACRQGLVSKDAAGLFKLWSNGKFEYSDYAMRNMNMSRQHAEEFIHQLFKTVDDISLETRDVATAAGLIVWRFELSYTCLVDFVETQKSRGDRPKYAGVSLIKLGDDGLITFIEDYYCEMDGK